MGSLITKHSMDKEHSMTVNDLNKQAVNDLVKQDAKKAEHVAEMEATCKRILTMLPMPEIIT